MTKAIVSGIAGFIGSNLAEDLVKKGVQVVGIDKDKSRQHVLAGIRKDVLMFWDDIKYIEHIADSVDDVDIVYHMAAASDIARSGWNPCYDLAENVVGTHEVLEFMRKKDIKNIIFPSTSVVYGEDVIRPTPEIGVEFAPISQYGASKSCCEAFIHAYSSTYGMKGWIFRFANVVGKNAQRGVIFDFMHKIGGFSCELKILGDGNQIKSYFHVSDCVNAITWIPEHDKNKGVEVYNLAACDYMTVTELAKIVCDELGVSPKFKYTGGDRGWQGDMPKIILSIKKALATGWKPKLNCEESIRLAVRELKDVIE